jgi:hypothetical protein
MEREDWMNFADSRYRDMPRGSGYTQRKCIHMPDRYCDQPWIYEQTPDPCEYSEDDDDHELYGSVSTTGRPNDLSAHERSRFYASQKEYDYDYDYAADFRTDDRREQDEGWDDDEAKLSFSEIAVADEDLMHVFNKVICKPVSERDESGVTVMLRDVPYRFQVMPDLMNMISQLSSLDSVSYIYLPMTISGPRTQIRNKGYGFIHFTDRRASEDFLKKIDQYEIQETPEKRMFGSLAKFQGVAANIHNVLDVYSKKWRPKHGMPVAYVRTETELACISLLALRTLAKHYSKFTRTKLEGRAQSARVRR